MSKIIDENLGVVPNLINCSYIVDKEVSIVNRMTSALAGATQVKYSADNETTIQKTKEFSGICDILDAINRYKKIVEIVKSIPEVLNEIATYCVNHIEYAASEIILKRVEIISLKTKKITLIAKKKAAELTKKVLQLCATGDGNALSAALIMPIILLYKAISILAAGILLAIQTILSLLPPIIAVNAEGMAFFMTPKSLKLTQMTIVNANQSVLYRLPKQVMSTLYGILKSIDKLNIPIKIAAVAAGAALGAAAVRDDKTFDTICPKLSKLNSKSLYKLIDVITRLLPLAQPLPKFENLSILNLGFLVWLMTGFVPAGRMSFGIPGQP